MDKNSGHFFLIICLNNYFSKLVGTFFNWLQATHSLMILASYQFFSNYNSDFHFILKKKTLQPRVWVKLFWIRDSKPSNNTPKNDTHSKKERESIKLKEMCMHGDPSLKWDHTVRLVRVIMLTKVITPA